MSEKSNVTPTPPGEPSFLPHPVMDRMLDALVALSAELCAERERRQVLESVLAKRGLLEAAELEQYVPPADEVAARKSARDAYVRRIFGSLGQP